MKVSVPVNSFHVVVPNFSFDIKESAYFLKQAENPKTTVGRQHETGYKVCNENF